MREKIISIPTIDNPEFINLAQSDISPLITKCNVKVCYVGQNRNKSFISKDVATQMGKTLPGSPIIGYYIEDKEDYGDHGDQMIIDGEGVRFNKLTKPYGFVPTNSRVWFQNFEETDAFGNKHTREYLMTEGYLWTGQYEECTKAIENRNPQSMELYEKTLKGYWSEDTKSGMEFFIIDSATIQALCILGEDVEPCFEGSEFSPATSFAFDDNFIKTFKEFTKLIEGDKNMPENETIVTEEVTTEFAAEETPETEFKAEEDKKQEEDPKAEDPKKKKEEPETENAKKKTQCEKDEEPETENVKKKTQCEKNDEPETENAKKKTQCKADEDPETENACGTKKKYDLVVEELEGLKADFEAMKAECESLREFKANIERKEKEELIASFYMLSDEDKKVVTENIDSYSLRDIKAELSMICVDKKINFTAEEEDKDVTTTFNLNSTEVNDIPAWLRGVEAIRKSRDI